MLSPAVVKLSLSISQSLNLSLSLRDRDRADTIITLPLHHTHRDVKDGGDIPVSSSWYYNLPNQIWKLVAGYIRPKHTSLTLFINLFQECRLHPSHSMIWSAVHGLLCRDGRSAVLSFWSELWRHVQTLWSMTQSLPKCDKNCNYPWMILDFHAQSPNCSPHDGFSRTTYTFIFGILCIWRDKHR